MDYKRWWWVFIWVISLVFLFLRHGWLDHSTLPTWGYVNAGAENPYYGVMRPLGYRLLMPVILNFMHVAPKPGEPFVPVLFASVMIVVFYGFLRGMGFSLWVASLGALLVLGSDGMIDLLRDFGVNNTDTSGHILILLALWAMVRGRDALFSTAVLVGVFNREWALVLLPTWYLYHYGFVFSPSPLGRFMRVSMPSIAVYLLVRYVYFPNTALGVMNGELAALLPQSETTTLMFYWQEIMNIRLDTFIKRVGSMDFFRFGMLGLLPFAIAGYRRVSQAWRRVCVFYGSLCVLQLFIAADVWRLAFYLFPVMVTLFCYWLQTLEEKASRVMYMASGILCVGGYLLLEEHIISLVFALFCVLALSRLGCRPGECQGKA